LTYKLFLYYLQCQNILAFSKKDNKNKKKIEEIKKLRGSLNMFVVKNNSDSASKYLLLNTDQLLKFLKWGKKWVKDFFTYLKMCIVHFVLFIGLDLTNESNWPLKF